MPDFNPYGTDPNRLNTGAQQVYAGAIAAGDSPAMASALVGRAYQENEVHPTATGDRGTSFGLFQVGAPVWNQWTNYARSNGLSTGDTSAQTQFMARYFAQNQP